MRSDNIQYTTYLTRNLVNGKQYYGAHKTSSITTDKYVGSGNLIKQAITKYGLDNFLVERKWIWDSPEEMMAVEEMAIGQYVVESSTWYNLKEGGTGGKNPNNKTRKQMSESRIQYFNNMTDDEKNTYSERCQNTWKSSPAKQKEEHANRSRLQWKNKTPEQLTAASDHTRQAWESLTSEQKIEREHKRQTTLSNQPPEHEINRKKKISTGIKNAWKNKTAKQIDVWKQSQQRARADKSESELKEWQDKKQKAMLSLPDVSCPHCNIKGKIGPMTRWHLDNCKHRSDT